jgi:ATP-binding cassette subfamily C protein EexD
MTPIKALFKLKRAFLFVGFVSLFVNIFMLAPALYILQLYDRVVTSRSYETLIFLTLTLLFIFVVIILLDWSRNQIMLRVSNRFDSDLKRVVFDSVFNWSIKEPTKANIAPFRDLSQIKNFIHSPILLAVYETKSIFEFII